MPLNFYLNREYVYCQYFAHDDKVEMSAALKVDTEKFKAGNLPKDQAAHLRRLQGLIDVYEVDVRQAGRQTLAFEVENILLEALGKKPKQNVKDSFMNVFDRYMKDVKAGNVLHDGKRYSNSFEKIADAVRPLIEKMPFANIPIGLVSEDDLRSCTVSLTNEGFAKNTVATYMIPILTMLNGTRRMKWHSGRLLDSKAYRAKNEDIDYGQYLNHDEMALIADLTYNEERTVWKDVFIMGCWLGMRYSDLSRLAPVHRQGDLVNINTVKTSTPVWVPLSSDAKEIWDKHNGHFFIPGPTTFRDCIKTWGEDAGIKKPVLFSRTQGGEKLEIWMKKYELLGTHTCRRSFATNAYKAGVPVASIMKVTGHRSTENFMKYIRLSDEEHAVLLAGHPFFK